MLRTQLLTGGLNMHKGYAMYYHVEISEISRVNLQIGLNNAKVQDVCDNFMEHHKKGEAVVSLYSMLWLVSPIAIIVTCYLYVSSIGQVY